MITLDLGIATAYGYAKSKGYTGTEEEFAELMASYATVAEETEESTEAAEAAKNTAISAKNDAVSAKTAAQTAQASAETASGTATTKAGEASTSAQNAASSASSASASATTASGYATTAQTAAGTATTKAQEASASATAAGTAKTGAETAQTAAETAQASAEEAAEAAEASATSISESAGQIETNKEDIAELKTQLESAYSAFVTETETGAIASFTDGADGVPVKDLTVAIEPVQSGSGDPSPENVRPISGWTGAMVTRTGVNLANYDDIAEIHSTASNLRNGLVFTKPGTYTVSASHSAGETDIVYARKYVKSTDTYDTVITIVHASVTASATFTITDGDKLILFDALDGATVSASKTLFETAQIQVETGSSATSYHAYTDTTYPISWQTEAGTVYGGTLDVTGVLTVDRAVITMDGTQSIGNNGALSYGGIQVVTTPSPAKKLGATNAEGLLSDKFKIADIAEPYTLVGRTSNANLVFNMPTDVTSIELAKTWFTNNPTQVSYLLATPQTYQLTPQEVSTILGQNNIFADCGNVTVQYRADTKLYIDKVVNS